MRIFFLFTITQPSTHDAHVRVRTLDVIIGLITNSDRAADLIRAITVAAIDDSIAATRYGYTLEVPALKLGLGIALRIHTVRFVTIITALVHAVASLRLRYTATVAAAELRRRTHVVRAEIARLVAIVRTMANTIAHKPLTYAVAVCARELRGIAAGH